jgi:bifunctional non-homologous end joining protein LigD
MAPMLAQPGAPFDSDDHLFEIKWDGVRMLVVRDASGYRLVNRHRAERTAQYPELACLAQLPAGTILDGEMVVLRAGQPDFGLLLSRDQTCQPLKIQLLARSLPATYVGFDLLYHRYRPLLDEPLHQRRAQLRDLVDALSQSQVVLSEGIVGAGSAFFRQVCALGLEGVVAKRLDSRYRPGRRTRAWIKIKPPRGVNLPVGG